MSRPVHGHTYVCMYVHTCMYVWVTGTRRWTLHYVAPARLRSFNPVAAPACIIRQEERTVPHDLQRPGSWVVEAQNGAQGPRCIAGEMALAAGRLRKGQMRRAARGLKLMITAAIKCCGPPLPQRAACSMQEPTGVAAWAMAALANRGEDVVSRTAVSLALGRTHVSERATREGTREGGRENQTQTRRRR